MTLGMVLIRTVLCRGTGCEHSLAFLVRIGGITLPTVWPSERSTNAAIPICQTRGAVAGLLSCFGQKGNVLSVAFFCKLISSKITLNRR